MQVQSTGYTQTINSQYSSRNKTIATTSSSSGDKVSISPEAKEKAQKMNSEKTQEEMGREMLELAALPDWMSGYIAPSMRISLNLEDNFNMNLPEEVFKAQHKNQTSEYAVMSDKAYSAIRKKYNISDSRDFANYPSADMENDFRTLLAENPRAKELMEILNVPKKL